jgi:polyisoprenoid-binding protein YceI
MTMMRNSILAAVLALSASAAFADSWTFDDSYWKQPATAGAVQAMQSDEVRGRYDQVDRYNP